MMKCITFLNILAASIGFISAAFFAVGAATMSPTDIYNTVVQRHSINQHRYESACTQRAEYLVGAALLILSFTLNIIANLLPADLSLPLLQPATCAAYMRGSVVVLVLLLLGALLVRLALAKACSRQVREMWEQETVNQTAKPT